MSGHVHVFDGRESGIFRISLSYQDQAHSLSGKTSEDTDTFQGRFVELIPYERSVDVIVFEAQEPRSAGEMRMIVSFADVDGGTEVAVLCEDIPEGIRPEDNEMGCKESLQKLAALIE